MEMRDLPELETVTSGGRAMHAISVFGWLLITIVLAAACAVATELLIGLIIHRWLGIPVCVALTLGFMPLIATWLARKSGFDWQWTTDAGGLTVSGLFRKRHIAWSEITEAKGKANSGGRAYYLKTESTKLTFADMVQASGELIGASIYQHLRRFGKADESLLTPSARTFWMPIPDEVPDEMDWHNPKPPNWSIALVVTVAIIIAAPIAYYLGPRIKLGRVWDILSHNGWLLIAGAYKALRDRLITARSVAIRRDHLEMRTPRGLVFLPWNEIRFVHWDNARKSLALGRAMYTDVAVIPYRAEWPDSAACILAIIRHLRLARHTPPVPIPTQLLSVMYSGTIAPVSAFSDSDAVEVKVAHASVGVAGVLLCAIPAAIIWWLMKDPARMFKMRIPSWIFMLPIVFVVVAAVVSLVARTTYRADSRGITVNLLGRRKFIDWRDVASYVVTPGRRGSRVLMDPVGRVLVKLPFSERADPSAESFTAYLDARLAPVRQHNLPTLMR